MTSITFIFGDGRRAGLDLPRERAVTLVRRLARLEAARFRIELFSPSAIVVQVGG